MKKIISTIIILFVLGCMPLANQTTDTISTNEEEYRTGNQGVSLRFIENIPPDRLYDIEPFSALIEITNEGTSSIGGVGDRIYLSGFDTTLIQGIPSTGIQIPKIEGRSAYIRNPESDTINFQGTLKDISRMRMDSYPTKIVATACYSYETLANAGVCIDPDPYSATIKQKVCIPETVYLGTQGAPIAVEEIEVIPSKTSTRFRIHIRNEGYGEVFKFGTNYLQKCSPYSQGLTFNDIDYIKLGDVIVSGTNIKSSCKPKDNTGHIRLTNGRATIICELTNIRSQTPFITPILITLKYGYRNAIFKDLTILPTN